MTESDTPVDDETSSPRPPDDPGATLVRNAVPGAPVNTRHVVPYNWRLRGESNDSAVFRIKETKDGPIEIPVSSRPIVVTRWIDNLTTKFKMLELAWCSRGKWRRAIVPREAARDSQKLMAELVRRGFPAQSETSRLVSSYLAAYEDRNIWEIDSSEISHQMGWVGEGEKLGFLCGRNAIGCDVEFLGTDVGDEQMADAVSQSGTHEDWAKAVSIVSNFPRVELALYASLAAPLLRILRSSNFCVDWAYSTSTGKTTTLRVAASVWGCPDERTSSSYITSWDSTQVGLEMLASTRNHLPLLVDDTKRAARFRGVSVVPKVIYEIAQGRGRGRGAKAGGSRATPSWRTVMLTTGESRAVDESKDAGAVARVVSLWGPPFGGDGAETAGIVAELNRGLCDNYGHAGPRFVQWLLDHRGSWPSYRDRCLEATRAFADRLPADGPNARVAEYLAVLHVACHLAHAALELPWSPTPLIVNMLPELAESTGDSDRALQALAHVYSWAVGRRAQFWGSGSNTTPTQGWLGRWDDGDTTTPAQWVGVLRPVLTAELRSAGHDAEASVRLWQDRGWLQSSGGKLSLVARVDGQAVRLIAIRMSAFAEIGALGDE